MLHYLDDLDSKMESMRAHFERGGDSEGFWTGFNPSLGRPLLNSARFLEKKGTGKRDLENNHFENNERTSGLTPAAPETAAAEDAPTPADLEFAEKKQTPLA